MFSKIQSLVQKLLTPTYLWPLGLFAITLIVAIANFKAGVWLTGWDTLHPEFDFALNFQRMLSGAWREDQGLGAVAAHSHMSDLPRIAMLWLFSWIMPLQSVKFVYVLLCLVLGPMGIYAYASQSIFKKHKQASLLGFIAGLVYLCNLGTVQHFYVVFEMFAVQFAAIGWLFWYATEFVTQGKSRWLLYFAVAALLASPMAYASTLWFAFALGIGVYLLLYSLLSKSKLYFSRTVLVGLILVAVNTFWLLPNAYFILSGASKIPQVSHINELFSSEAFLHNQAYGTLTHVALLRNFLFNWTQYEVSTNTFGPLMAPWIDHLKNPVVLTIGYSIFALFVAGITWAIKTKDKLQMSIVSVGLLSAFMVINANFPFEWFFNFLREHSNLFEEGLRFPFTKFSILLMFAMSILVATSVSVLLEWLRAKQFKLGKHPAVIGLICTVLLTYYFLPAFTGNLINNKMKNTIPSEYFALFDWFKTQPPQARVAQLPLQTNAGWDYYTWNYEGPGFIWFGISQPLLVRDFDRWNPNNETFYNQAAHALYSGTKDEFFTVLTQYGVKYVLVDESIISPGQENYSLAFDKVDAFLKSSETPLIWQQGFLKVYDVSSKTQSPEQAYTRVTPTIPTIDSASTYSRFDTVYQTMGNYVTDITDHNNSLIYPFADLMSDRAVNMTVSNQAVTIERTLPESATGYNIVIPALTDKTPISLSYAVEYREGEAILTFPPALQLSINSQVEEIPLIEQTVVIPLEISPEELTIGIGSSLTRIAKGEKTQPLLTTLPANSSITVVYGDATDSAQLRQYSIISPEWQNRFSEQVIHFSAATSEKSTMQLTIPTAAIPLYIYDTTSTKNCAQNGIGNGTQINQEKSILLEAKNKGAACKFFELPQVSLNDSFVLGINGANIQGRSLKYYIRNTFTAHNELEHMLPADQFNAFYTVLRHSYVSATDSFYNPYALTIESRSFGSRTSTNELNNMELYPIPLAWITSVHAITVSPTASAPVLSPISVKRYNSAHFDVHVSKEPFVQYVLFEQSQDSGWIAFPRFQFWKPFKQYSFNGWANAWQIPANTQYLTVIFWPQLLSTLGYFVVISTILVLSFSLKNDKAAVQTKMQQLTTKFSKIMKSARLLFTGSHR